MVFLTVVSDISDTNSFVSEIFGTVKLFFEFFIKFLSNIPSYVNALIDFLITYVIELPIYLVSMFGELPIFVQTGLIVLLYALYIAFIFRIMKLIIPFL